MCTITDGYASAQTAYGDRIRYTNPHPYSHDEANQHPNLDDIGYSHARANCDTQPNCHSNTQAHLHPDTRANSDPCSNDDADTYLDPNVHAHTEPNGGGRARHHLLPRPRPTQAIPSPWNGHPVAAPQRHCIT